MTVNWYEPKRKEKCPKCKGARKVKISNECKVGMDFPKFKLENCEVCKGGVDGFRRKTAPLVNRV